MVDQLAVLGSPIDHSLSPVLHRAADDALDLAWTYDARHVASGELPGFLAGLGPNWRGLSLTMPLKHEALSLVDDLDQVARLTGAVNTLRLHYPNGQRQIAGFNTDVAGLVAALQEAGASTLHRPALLGAGATASSALVALAELGASQADVYVRTPGKARPLIELGQKLGIDVRVDELSGLAAASPKTDLVLSTLPGGTRLAEEFPVAIRSKTLLYDVSYSPWPSTLAQSWLRAGGTVFSGVTMLLHQALVQVRIFVSGDAQTPLANEAMVLRSMRDALDAALVLRTTPPAVKE
jgi:shikimate dehydrogenase